jgi:hypothetical protein
MRGAVDVTTNGKTAQLPTLASTPFFGASNNKADAAAGDQLHIIQMGQAIGTANAAITRGQELIMIAVTGKLAPATGVPPEQIVGVAEENASANEFFAYTIRVYKTA